MPVGTWPNGHTEYTGATPHSTAGAPMSPFEDTLHKLGTADLATPDIITMIKGLPEADLSTSLTTATTTRMAIQKQFSWLPMPDLTWFLKAVPGLTNDRRKLFIELILAHQLKRFLNNKHLLPVNPRDFPALIKASFKAQKKILMNALMNKFDEIKTAAKEKVELAIRKLNFIKNAKIRMFVKQLDTYATKNPLDALKHFAYGISLMNTNRITGKPLRMLRQIKTYRKMQSIGTFATDLATQIKAYAGYPDLIAKIKTIADSYFNPQTNPMPGVVTDAFATVPVRTA